ncbi:lysophospholipid acyltransferase family protein [Tepidibacter hydrothermalis]|uniref:1-acyl-sn-glycerol-3-phosphate acyltransferase n=1 Tax=Tepidibacter hydrothermalis TaxID=3036126 RepID=A0ABY8EH76_9FIRM|nr:lysophospholipid acyltransferase family protein [Tepidibacter hydrothermalis]WFD12273.1 lysophospholipid acyltransferase family protein [Tepidibacter hydrothermalis]
MLRTIRWFIYFWYSLIALIPDMKKAKKLDEQGDIAKKDQLVSKNASNWAKALVELTDTKVNVIGEDNIPKDEAVLFVSNHQGNFDIPILLGFINKPKAFVAKEELRKMPLLRTWMEYMNCIFLNRSNNRESVKAIKQGIENLKQGYSMVIFPEGTRSKDGKLGEFKPGALKLATKSKVRIVPVTINGSKDIMEKGSFIIKPADVEVIISKPVEIPEGMDKDTKSLAENIKNIIKENLK